RPTRSTPFPYTTLFRSALTQQYKEGAPRGSFCALGNLDGFLGLLGWCFLFHRQSQDTGLVISLNVFVADCFGQRERTGETRVVRSEEHTSELQSRENLV